MELTKNSLDGPFLGFSYAEQRTEFVNWVKAGNRPDQHPAVLPAEIPPPDSKEIAIIGEVALHSSFEDRTSWFHCNACGCKEKFKGGGFCASVGDGFWYLVGPDCGSEEHQRLLNRGLLQYNAEQANASIEQRVGKFHSRFRDWKRVLDLGDSAAREAMSFRKAIKQIERFNHDMVTSRKGGGKLDFRVLIRNGGDEWLSDRVEEQVFGTLSGWNLFIEPFIATGCVKKAKKAMTAISGSDQSSAGFEECFLHARNKKGLKKFEADVLDAETHIRHLVDAISDAKAFVSRENAQLIERWYKQSRKERDAISKALPFHDEPDIPKYKVAIDSSYWLLIQHGQELVRHPIGKIQSFDLNCPY